MAKKAGAGTVIVAAVLAMALANSDEGQQAATPGPGPGVAPMESGGHAARLAASQEAARRGDFAAASQRLGMRAGQSGRRRDTDCAAHASGQVREYLRRNPCRYVDRLLFTIRDSGGGTMAVAVAWVTFRTPAQAREFKRIDDIWGTGQIDPLPGATAGIPDVRLSGQHYRSRRNGALAVVAEAEPVTGRQTDQLLDEIAGVAVLLPHAPPPSDK